MRKRDLKLNGPATADTVILLAHGAGAPMDHPSLEFIARGLGKCGFRVARFEFPYMAARRESGKRPGPDREPKLRETWHAAIDLFPNQRQIIGGKSMGGRIASLIADEANAAGLVCIGYPFHPPGKPTRLRTEHLKDIQTPTLIVQGTRDTFGKPDEVATYDLSRNIEICWMDDGDHGLKPRKSSGRTEEQNWQGAIDAIASFVERLA